MIGRQVRSRRDRSIALGVGILVASVSFSLLTAATTTSTTQVQGTVARNLRPAYDILVRPPGSTTELEANEGLVRDNYLSGIFGGVTLKQYEQIQKIPGVQIAAPIAMIGYVLQEVQMPIDVTSVLPPDAAEVLTLTDNRTTDQGLTRFPPSSVGYVYVTDDPLQSQALKPGTGITVTPTTVIGSTEVLPNGQKITVCPSYFRVPNLTSPFSDYQADDGFCWSRQNLTANAGPVQLAAGHVGGYVNVVLPFLVAAIDPVAEQQLVGLGNAVTSGRYLQPTDRAVTIESDPRVGSLAPQLQVPVLATTIPFVDDTDQVTVDRLPASAVDLLHEGLLPGQLAAALAKETHTPVEQVTVAAQEAYQQILHQLSSSSTLVDAYWTSGPTTYRQVSGGELTPLPVTNPSSVWTSSLFSNGFEAAPVDSTDVGFRQLKEELRTNTSSQLLTLHAVGEFDPTKLPGFSTLSQVPLETYYPPQVTGADAASQKALGNQPLLPNANMAGYLQQPPLILTTLNSLPAFEQDFPTVNATAPISVVRVRVGGLHGSVRQQLAEIGQVATAIRRATGLDVDITAGSSPTTETIALPAGRAGRPALALKESWVRKAVALVILNAVDAKSVVLFVLVLVVCVLFLGNGAYASVRSRRTELGVLACLGWGRAALFRLVLGELALVGLVTGVIGAALAEILALALRLDLPWWHALLVVPIALGLACVAGIAPAFAATRGRPLDAVSSVPGGGGRHRAIHHASGIARVNLLRRPARLISGALGLFIGVAAFAVLLAVQLAFQGQVVGTALGNLVSVQVRSVDLIAAVLALLLGAFSVADVLAVNLRDRAGEQAVLAATGWRPQTLFRLAFTEGMVVGIVGAIAGGAVGLGLAAILTGSALAVAPSAVLAAVIGLILVGAVLMVPAWQASQTAPAAALAED